MDTTRGRRAAAPRALLLAAVAFLGACGGDPAFRVEGIEPAGRPLARNEALVVRFTRELGPEAALSPLVTVRGADGGALDLEATTSGRSLLLRPGEGEPWPPGPELRLRVRRGLALAFSSADGVPLEEDFEARVALSSGFRDLGVPFELVEIRPPSERLVGPGGSFRLRFSLPLALPLSPDALAVEGPEGALRPEVEAIEGGRSLIVRPFPEGRGFRAGSRFVIRPSPEALRSVTGRTLAGDPRPIAFWTSPIAADEGFVDIEFSLAALEGAAERSGWARPVLAPYRAVTLHRSFTDRSHASRRRPSAAPFGRDPSRVQMLLSGDTLGDEPGLVTGFSWFATEVPALDPVFPRLVVRIGEAAPEARATGLLQDFESNFAGSGPLDPLTTVPEGSESGAWAPGLPTLTALAESPAGGWIDVGLARPYYYPGGRRSLVLEIRNELGCCPAEPLGGFPEGFEGLLWAAGEPPGPERLIALVEDPQAAALPRNLGFATKIRIERYEDFVSPWHEASLDRPVWFVIPGADHLDAEGVEEIDFRFEFQGRRDDGSETPWGRLEALKGCRSIRAKLSFLPNSGRNAKSAPEVRRLRLRYRRGRDN